MKIDLLLGSDIGVWALNRVSRDQIEQVITLEEPLAERARSLGLQTLLGNANSMNYVPSRVGFSLHYQAILKAELMAKYERIYNLHPGYLPWGRGYYPIFWALWEETPAGATLHEITAGVDEGPIVAQIRVQYNESDTGGSLFQRIRKAEESLFLEYFPQMIEGKNIPTHPQADGGTFHRKKEFYELKQQAEWEKMSSADLLRLVRALTFPGHSGLELSMGQERFELHLNSLNDGLIDA
jgi:methionyl-tRNA formyltransferase